MPVRRVNEIYSRLSDSELIFLRYMAQDKEDGMVVAEGPAIHADYCPGRKRAVGFKVAGIALPPSWNAMGTFEPTREQY